MLYVYDNLEQVEKKAKALMKNNRKGFSHKAMTKLLNEIVDNNTKHLVVSNQVTMKLPKLKKVNEEAVV